MNKSGPPTRLAPSEYEAIEQAMMETERGRWFLSQFAEKNRRKDTQVVLEAISKLESTVSTTRSQPEAERIKMDLVEMSQAISRTRNEIANLKLPEHDGGNLLDATEELDSIVSTTERATNKILQAAEDIQETAWTIREDGSFEAPCARIDTDVTDIYTACSFQDITGQRTQKVVHILRYLEARINAMVSIWGLDQEEFTSAKENDSQSISDSRPDAHLLNGPQLDENALKQDDIDGVMEEALEDNNLKPIGKNENQAEIDITAKFIAQTAHEVEALTIQAVEVAEELILAAETIAEEADEELTASDHVAEAHDESPLSEQSDTSLEISSEPVDIPVSEEVIPEENDDFSATNAFEDIADSPELIASDDSMSDTNTEDLSMADEDIQPNSIHDEQTEALSSEVIENDDPSDISLQNNEFEGVEENAALTETIEEEDHILAENHEEKEISAELTDTSEDITIGSLADDITETAEQPAGSDDDTPLIEEEVESADSIINALAQELDAIKDVTVEATEDADRETLNVDEVQGFEQQATPAFDQDNTSDNSIEAADTGGISMELSEISEETPPPLPLLDEDHDDHITISQEQASFVEHFSRIQEELQSRSISTEPDAVETESSAPPREQSDYESEAQESLSTENALEAELDTEIKSATENESKTETEQQDKGYKSSDWVGQNLYLLLEEEENEQPSDEDTMSSRLRDLPASAKTAAFE